MAALCWGLLRLNIKNSFLEKGEVCGCIFCGGCGDYVADAGNGWGLVVCVFPSVGVEISGRVVSFAVDGANVCGAGVHAYALGCVGKLALLFFLCVDGAGVFGVLCLWGGAFGSLWLKLLCYDLRVCEFGVLKKFIFYLAGLKFWRNLDF